MDLVFYLATLVTTFSAGALWALRPTPLPNLRRSRSEAVTAVINGRS